jgi:hypothetical protein
VFNPDCDPLNGAEISDFGAGLADDSPYYDPDVIASSEPYHVDGYWPPSIDDDNGPD